MFTCGFESTSQQFKVLELVYSALGKEFFALFQMA